MLSNKNVLFGKNYKKNQYYYYVWTTKIKKWTTFGQQVQHILKCCPLKKMIIPMFLGIKYNKYNIFDIKNNRKKIYIYRV